MLGVQLRPIEDSTSGAGWQSCQLLAGGPAAEAGIESGDLIVEWDGQSTATMDGKDMEKLLQSIKIGAKVNLTVLREGETHHVTLEAVKPDPLMIEAWLVSYVYYNFSEDEFRAYEARVEERFSDGGALPVN